MNVTSNKAVIIINIFMQGIETRRPSVLTKLHYFTGHTDLLSDQSYLSLENVICHQGSSSGDAANNRKMSGIGSSQDCYTFCLKTNDGYCFEFRYIN